MVGVRGRREGGREIGRQGDGRELCTIYEWDGEIARTCAFTSPTRPCQCGAAFRRPCRESLRSADQYSEQTPQQGFLHVSPDVSKRDGGKKKNQDIFRLGRGEDGGGGQSDEGLRLILDILCLTFSPPKRRRRGGRSGGRGTRLLQQSVATGGGS